MLFSMPPSWSSLITFTSGGISRMMFGLFCKPNIDEQSPDPGLRESGTSLRRSLESTRILSPIWNAFYQAAVDSEVRVQQSAVAHAAGYELRQIEDVVPVFCEVSQSETPKSLTTGDGIPAYTLW